METVQPTDDGRATKRQRVGVDPAQNGIAFISAPELDRIKQSDNQLAYLQAQLAATESLYSAYQAELQGLSKELGDVKQSHLRSGLPLWKDAAPAAEAAAEAPARRARRQEQRQLSPGGAGQDDIDTYSDIEEEVLLLQMDERTAAEQQQQQQGEQGAAAEGSSPQPAAEAAPQGEAAAGTATAATADPGPQAPGEGAVTAVGAGAAVADGSAAGAGAEGAAGGMAARAAAAAGTATGAPGLPAREGLEALEATCSAVAQEDMEAQGAVACLAGRTAKYYLRSTVVSLGRTTDTKGDVDLDLTPEEPPPRAAPAAAGAGDQGAAQTQPGAAAPQASLPPAGHGGHVVSRRQALIRIGADGQFRLVNTGRQPVVVNDVVVPQHHTVNLPHLSLIEVAAVRLLFMANMAAVSRVVRRSAALSL